MEVNELDRALIAAMDEVWADVKRGRIKLSSQNQWMIFSGVTFLYVHEDGRRHDNSADL
jgi:hypothetical protein